jgi:chromosome segregation protein
VALAKLHESDAILAAVAEELGQHGSLARSARDEAHRITAAIEAAEAARDRDLEGLAELQERLRAAQDTDDLQDTEPDLTERDRRADAVRRARQVEMDARLALRTAEERERALAGRAASLLRAADEERQARRREAARRERLEREGRTARAVAAGARTVLHRLEVSLAAADEERRSVEEGRAGREAELLSVRARLRDLTREHGELVDTVHRDELARAEQRMRIEQIQERASVELGLEPETLVRDYGPDNPVAGSPEDDDRVPFVREEQEQRLRTAERELATLGRINPLALEEFSALEERHGFLSEQLEDLRRTRRDLLDIVREVDARVEQVFTEAWHDVAREFEDVFQRLFPGGEGSLVLTDPSDLLTTGVEVEARPAGKRVKRLSLLSGGERSLVAVAFLVALFKARPSPFYILDEVEAALDDTNLGRLLQIYEELRESSQLLVITHQKRTMEVGDALYGVTMRGDGVSTVISQRLRDDVPA